MLPPILYVLLGLVMRVLISAGFNAQGTIDFNPSNILNQKVNDINIHMPASME